MKSSGTNPRKPVTACGTEHLVRIYEAAENTVLRITMLLVLVDLLKQSSVTNRAPEQLGNPVPPCGTLARKPHW